MSILGLHMTLWAVLGWVGNPRSGKGGASVRKQKGKGIKGGGCVHKLLVTMLV